MDCARAPPKTSLFVPPGSLIHITFLDTLAAKDKKKTVNIPWASCVHIPISVADWNKKMPDTTIRAMEVCNAKPFKEKMGWSMRKAKSDVYQACFPTRA